MVSFGRALPRTHWACRRGVPRVLVPGPRSSASISSRGIPYGTFYQASLCRFGWSWNRVIVAFMYIDDERSLKAFCDTAKREGALALDTEFVRVKTYFPKLGIVQTAARKTVAIIDPLGGLSLAPLMDLVADPEVEIVVHCGAGDFEVLYLASGRPPRRVFDTQVAAALAGLGESLSYQALVAEVLGVELAKGETRSDWRKRPLTEEQIDYAKDDVRFLFDLRDRLASKLGAMERLGWLWEETSAFEDASVYRSTDPKNAFLTVRGCRGLDSHALAILRELAAWREKEAVRLDLPRNWVVKDDVLVTLARRPPAGLRQLVDVSGVPRRFRGRAGREFVKALDRGRRSGDLPEPLTVGKAESKRRKKLKSWLNGRAKELSIPPALLASKQILAGFLDVDPKRRASAKILNGWRRPLVADGLEMFLEGGEPWSADAKPSGAASDGSYATPT